MPFGLSNAGASSCRLMEMCDRLGFTGPKPMLLGD